MANIEEVFSKYKTVKLDDLNEIEAVLKQIKSDDLQSVSEHKTFIELLASFRSAIIKAMEALGENAIKTLESLFSTGEDGIYSNNLRFIYELIQNVDDCDYFNLNNCNLEIKFDTCEGYDTIELRYNEKGFEPKDVFAITGIAAKSKNITSGKIEIGEKGIGFKSVFGIADSVLIQSGKFSFELNKGNFIVPIPKYEHFTGVKGTKLTLRLEAGTAHWLYREIADLYSNPAVLLNRNPILFLNKLTKIRFYTDAFRDLQFNVSRQTATFVGNVKFESDVIVSLKIKDHYNGRTRSEQKEIHCYRYKMPIVYDEKACSSRYPNDVSVKEKSHLLVAVFPHIKELDKIKDAKGALYSFFPTQIKMSIPMLLHAPYKLNGSREYIDPEQENEWFKYTNEKLCEFFKTIYSDLATHVKEDIIRYIPTAEQYFFVIDRQNDKLKCLQKDYFRGKSLSDIKLFYTAANTFETAKDVVAFSARENIADHLEMYVLLSPQKRLFVSRSEVSMSYYGVEVIKDAYNMLFEKAMDSPSITSEALDLLCKNKDFNFDERIEALGKKSLTAEQILVICKHENILRAFERHSKKRITNKQIPSFNTSTVMTYLDDSSYLIISDTLEDVTLGDQLLYYIDSIKNQYTVAQGIGAGMFFVCGNMLILSEDEPLSAFASFAELFVKNKNFMASLRMRQESEKLNSAILNESMSNAEYLKTLQRVRKSVIDVLSKTAYENYIQIINKSGVDENRFIHELLQNADDCSYSKTKQLASFSFSVDGDNLVTHYNEDGFTKSNVRSITAIGESTKKLMLDGGNYIGEKGVGFKSVFGIAKSVIINSNGFRFQLKEKRPTVPAPIPAEIKIAKIVIGTEMTFELKKILPENFLTEEKVLALCLCLRKLKIIRLGSFDVEIEDTTKNRQIRINESIYIFQKFEYIFTVKNDNAIAERENQQRHIERTQKICFYIPDKDTIPKIKKYFLHSGLPTTIEIKIPLVIDAPFETSTSREGILQGGLWNGIIRDELYKALPEMLHTIKQEKKTDVLDYIRPEGFFVNDWLNLYPSYQKLLSEAEIVPLIDGSFVSPKKKTCSIYPDVCCYAFANGMTTLDGINIVARVKSNYHATLKWLGCQTPDYQKVMSVIEDTLKVKSNIVDSGYRKLLYSYLKDHSHGFAFRNMLDALEIIPVKPCVRAGATLYVSSREKIYTAPELLSPTEYYLLDESILKSEEFYELFQRVIPAMDEWHTKYIYQEKIMAWLKTVQDKRKLAEMLLNEFTANRSMLNGCRDSLRGRISDIPFKFSSGKFATGNKYTNTTNTEFFGEIVPPLVVASEYQEFAVYLDCKSIFEIHYGDIDVEADELTADDIEDFLDNEFVYADEILQHYIDEGKIPYKLLEQYKLLGLVTDEIDTADYDFPSNRVKNISQLRKHIKEAQLNEFTLKTITRQEPVPEYPFDKRKYALDEYCCDIIGGRHFCQMCEKVKSKKYIEVNAIELKPMYAWEQMQLCLCLICSKDFEALRQNEKYRNDFLFDLQEADFNADEPIAVAIGSEKIHFTATHLAEVQEILKRQSVTDDSTQSSLVTV